MDLLDNLRTFLAVVEDGNFSAASRRLKVAVSVVKKRIDHLESQVGVVLFERSTRSMSLTDAGRRHLLKTRAVVNQLDQLLSQMASQPTRVEGRLRVKVPTGTMGAFLGEKLNRFLDLHPGISMEVSLIHRPVNPIEEGFDLCVELGSTTWPGVAHFALRSIKRHLVASPRYLAMRGTPRVPGDLVMHDILNYESRGLIWTFQGKKGPLEVRINPRLSSNSALHLMEAACRGNGICLMSEYISQPFVERGDLVAVLDDYPVADLWACLHIPEDRLDLSHVQALRTHLLASVSTSGLQIQAPAIPAPAR